MVTFFKNTLKNTAWLVFHLSTRSRSRSFLTNVCLCLSYSLLGNVSSGASTYLTSSTMSTDENNPFTSSAISLSLTYVCLWRCHMCSTLHISTPSRPPIYPAIQPYKQWSSGCLLERKGCDCVSWPFFSSFKQKQFLTS